MSQIYKCDKTGHVFSKTCNYEGCEEKDCPFKRKAGNGK
jgi:hypothetical protein